MNRWDDGLERALNNRAILSHPKPGAWRRAMPADHTKQLTPATLGDGVYDPRDFRTFNAEEATVVRLYHDDPDASVVVWNLEPGQENDSHEHPSNLHVFYRYQLTLS